ncbi:Kinase a-anchor protein, partial [Globisporangium splendens]
MSSSEAPVSQRIGDEGGREEAAETVSRSQPGGVEASGHIVDESAVKDDAHTKKINQIQSDVGKDPSALARELVRKSMLICFAADTIPAQERERMLRSIQRIMRGFAQRLLHNADPTASSQPSENELHIQAHDTDAERTRHEDNPRMLPTACVAPPRAYFSFYGDGQMHLPIVNWGSFRGYSVALWINAEFLLPQLGDGAKSVGTDDDLHAKFNLFRFVNGSSTLGVEASIEFDKDGPNDGRQSVLLNISSSNPSVTKKQQSSAASILSAPVSTPLSLSDWKHTQHRIYLAPGQWHLLVVSHSLHYVKKSKVTCYVDTKRQFHEELAYPSGLVTASKCTIGGGRNTAVKLASATMYEEELSSEMIGLLYAQGPMISSFNRWATAPPNQLANHVFGDFHGVTVASSPLSMPYSDLFSAYCKLQIVFCFTAHDVANEDYSGLGVEWLSEGNVADNAAKWVTMENTTGASAEIQQRNARLGKNVQKVVFPDSHAALYRVLGVVGMPVLLHYILTGYENICKSGDALKSPSSRCQSEADGVVLGSIMESVLVDFMWIIKGMLLNRVNNQQELLQNYVFHVLCHVLVKHQARVRNIWTPQSLLVCVDMIKSMHKMLPSRQKESLNINHPLQESIWGTNPLFASGIRAVLMDYRLWSTTEFKLQSIYNRKLYELVCDYPRLFNDMQTVSKVLEVLRRFYTSSEVADTKTQSAKSKENRDKNDEWKHQCVDTLVEVIEVCLTNQSVFVHEVVEDELLETTFARPTNANSAQVGGSSTNAPGSTSTTSSFAIPRRQGGVFSISLENIVWSDQRDGTDSSSRHHDGKEHLFPAVPSMASPGSVQVRFSLVRNIRAIARFLMANQDPVVCCSILLMLRRLAVSYLDVRFALISSTILDCLLFLMHRPDSVGEVSSLHSSDADIISVRMACIPLFIYLMDWLESIEGRTVWCGLEEHLRMILSGEGTFSIGFLELMTEFYFNPPWLLGAQQSIIMNDPSKKNSVLFPGSVSKSKSPSIHESGIIVTANDGISGTSISADISSGINGRTEWIRLASKFGGKRLSLAWKKRIAVIKMTALRNLVASFADLGMATPESPSKDGMSAFIADMFDEGVAGVISLPLRGVLPFLSILLEKSSPGLREKVLMDINVKLKTDETTRQQLLLMKREWAEALLELSLVCACQAEEVEAEDTGVAKASPRDQLPDGDDEEDVSQGSGRSQSFDSCRTGEDLVLDTIVSVLCTAMNNESGWQSFTELILALKSIRLKYEHQQSPDADTPIQLLPAERVDQAELYCQSLDWLSRVTAIVLQRMTRGQSILSRALAGNVEKVLFLAYETLLALPLRPASFQPSESSFSRKRRSSSAVSGWIWTDAQLFLLNVVLDVCARLIQSTHKLHRVGLLPGLQILQRSLPFISEKAMMERVIEVLISSFQQEMGTVAALRVFDSIPTREVFLSAMVSLRRALLIQEDEELLGLLRVLTLRITTSGSFADDLRAAGLTVQALSEMTEADASIAALDALALSMNETEMHKREEEADFVPRFPEAKYFLNSQRRLSSSVQDDEEKEIAADYQSQFVDEDEKLLWAALEVEENWMMESIRDLAEREKHHIQSTGEVLVIRKNEWTEKLWVKQEYTFRSQHQYSAMRSRAPGALCALQQAQTFRIGLYETPHPSRMRRTLDIDLKAEQKDGIPTGRADDPEARRRQYPLPLDTPGLDAEAADSPAGLPSLRANELLLERVGRVVAEQGGGEIQDITADPSKYEDFDENGDDQKSFDAAHADFGVTNDKSSEGGGIGLQLAYDQLGADTTEEDKPPSPSAESSRAHLIAGNTFKPPAAYADCERQYESGLDPGEGVAVSVQDHLVARACCRRVIPEGIVFGTLYLCHEHLAFKPDSPSDPMSGKSSRDSEDESVTAWKPQNADEAAPGLHRCWRWRYYHIVAIYLRRYRLRDSAIEIFFRNGSNHFLDFPFATKHQRNELVRLLYSFVPRSVPKQWPGRGIPNLGATTKAWQNHQISNFDYLMALNTFAGRSFNDLTQYPVFPWVLSNYEDESLDLSDARNFRDLSKPMGALNPARLEESWERYNSFDDPLIPKFLYGSHYSTCAGVVLFFLFRLQPFAELQRRTQGGSFDLPDRLFHSIRDTWNMCNSHMSEVKELTPEFYCDGNFLRNVNRFSLGKRQDQHVVNDVQLPKWAATPEEFIRIHRAALESDHVSQHLHEWIDLIFGFKQRGKAALKANNVFYYLTYYGVVDLDRIKDPFLRESMELQIAHFGQCPMQLFGAPHPKRTATATFGRRSLATVGGEATVTSPPVSTTGGLKSGMASLGGPGSMKLPGSSGSAAANIARPLSLSFQDISLAEQEKRRKWSPSVDVKPLVPCAIRLTKVLPDRIVTVDELGVISMYNWRIASKPQPQHHSASRSSPPVSLTGSWADATPTSPSERESMTEELPSAAVHSKKEKSTGKQSPKSSPRHSKDSASAFGESLSAGTQSEDAQCPWLLEAVRDDSPLDFIPRIPFHEERDGGNNGNFFPVAISSNGRVIISGGGRGGALHFRLLDLDNGQVVGKASVTGHDGSVTCISVDKLTYNSASNQHDEEELIVSGSKDGTMALWRLSRVKQDLLFRLPRISSAPIMVLRGHSEPIRDCCVSTYLGLVVSCSEQVGMVHYLHSEGQVAFVFEPPEVTTGQVAVFTQVRVSHKGFVLAVSRIQHDTNQDREEALHSTSDPVHHGDSIVRCVCQVYNFSGVLVHTESFEGENVIDVVLSAEGDLVFLTVSPGMIRICRLEDFACVQEYLSPDHIASPISAIYFGPKEAVVLIASGHEDGTLVLQLLPDADGSLSLLASVRKMLGVSSKMKMVKGTVQHAQNLAMTTLGNAKAATNTARDIAGEALGEAKSMVRGFLTYLQRQSQEK